MKMFLTKLKYWLQGRCTDVALEQSTSNEFVWFKSVCGGEIVEYSSNNTVCSRCGKKY